MGCTHPVRRTRPALPVAIVTVLVLVSCSGPSPVMDFYVDPATGNDSNPGSAAKPFRTLTHALQSALPGHTVHLAAGTYSESTGEVWPTQTGAPPTGEPNVPDGVNITTDGNAALLSGPGGITSTVALVFGGQASVSGVAIDGFLRGVSVGEGANAVLADVDVTGSAREGVLVHGDGQLTLSDSFVHENEGTGVAVQGAGVATIEAGSRIRGNATGVIVSDSAFVTLTGIDLFANGSATPGGQDSGVWVRGEGTLLFEDGSIRNNNYAGIYMEDAATVTVGQGASIHENSIGIVAEDSAANVATLDIEGATIWQNDFEGVYWGMLGARFSVRDTEIIDNGDNGILISGDALVIDLGTFNDPGGNRYVGNAEPYILDNRPDRFAADGTVITVSYFDTLFPCVGTIGMAVGPVTLSCNGVNVIGILHNFNRVEVIGSP